MWQYFPVVPCKLVLIFGAVDKVLECDHSYESIWKVFFVSDGTVCFYKLVLSIKPEDNIPWCDDSNESFGAECFLAHYFPVSKITLHQLVSDISKSVRDNNVQFSLYFHLRNLKIQESLLSNTSQILP